MQASLLYREEKIGQREIFTLYGTGPASYSQTTGDSISLPNGLYIDTVLGNGVMSVSKTYFVRAYPSAVGTTRSTWTLKWFVVSTGAEVTNATNLSAESVQFAVLGGEF